MYIVSTSESAEAQALPPNQEKHKMTTGMDYLEVRIQNEIEECNSLAAHALDSIKLRLEELERAIKNGNITSALCALDSVSQVANSFNQQLTSELASKNALEEAFKAVKNHGI